MIELFQSYSLSSLPPGGLFVGPGPTGAPHALTGEAPLSALAAGRGRARYLDQERLLHMVLEPGAHDLDLHVHFAYLKWEKHKRHHLGGGGGHDHHLAGWGSWA